MYVCILVAILVTLADAEDTKVRVIETSCQVVEVDYHVTMFTLRTSSPLKENAMIQLYSHDPKIAFPLEQNITLTPDHADIPRVVFVYGKKVGSTYIRVKAIDSEASKQLEGLEKARVDVNVVHSATVAGIAQIIGWIYFLAWSISFYPQAYVNFKRKSVIGLNFDFLAFNITGFLAYGFFNIGLYYVPSIQKEYFAKFPGNVIPVQPNDVFFCIHAVILTIITIGQCFIYERGDQRMSKISIGITSVLWAFALISIIPAGLGKINWYTYLTYFSYIKLAVTLIKYIPQAYMNYQRKSTVGWSIGNILLDFTGGSLSVVQMFMIAYNNAEWNSIFGDFTKFALGLFSVLFDIFFMLQHYVFYRIKTVDASPAYAPIES